MKNGEVVIKTVNLKKHFLVKNKGLGREKAKLLKAVDGINLDIKKGETVGIAGESGCGKTTTAKVVLGLYPPTAGTVYCQDVDIHSLKDKEMKWFRKNSQMVFQDPYESLNPRFKIMDILKEPLDIHNIGNKAEKLEMVQDILHSVGLNPPKEYLGRFPHELSGGQRQRVAIARAIILKPSFLVADEPVSMLDVSIRASILSLLQRLINQLSLASIYISHDLSLIRYLCDRTAIMYLGRIVEIGPTELLLKKRLHPYTQALLEAVPLPDPKEKYSLEKIIGEAPDPVDLPIGCRFYSRCIKRTEKCLEVAPISREVEKDYWVECHYI